MKIELMDNPRKTTCRIDKLKDGDIFEAKNDDGDIIKYLYLGEASRCTYVSLLLQKDGNYKPFLASNPGWEVTKIGSFSKLKVE